MALTPLRPESLERLRKLGQNLEDNFGSLRNADPRARLSHGIGSPELSIHLPGGRVREIDLPGAPNPTAIIKYVHNLTAQGVADHVALWVRTHNTGLQRQSAQLPYRWEQPYLYPLTKFTLAMAPTKAPTVQELLFSDSPKARQYLKGLERRHGVTRNHLQEAWNRSEENAVALRQILFTPSNVWLAGYVKSRGGKLGQFRFVPMPELH